MWVVSAFLDAMKAFSDYSSSSFGFAGDSPRHWLECNGPEHVRHFKYSVCHIKPVVVVSLHDLCADCLVRQRSGLSSNSIPLAAQSKSVADTSTEKIILLQNKNIVMFKQVIVAIPRFSSIGRSDCCKVGKNTLWWLRPVVEEEHDPGVDQQAMLTSHNDGRLVIGIMLGEVTKSAQDLRRLIGCKDIVSSPYLCFLDTPNEYNWTRFTLWS